MKTLLMVKDFKVKTLVSGDKTLRITLDTLYPEDIQKLTAILTPKIEIEVDFKED